MTTRKSLSSCFPLPRHGSKDRCTISIWVWVDPIVHPDDFDARYAEMTAANFTDLLGGFSYPSFELGNMNLNTTAGRHPVTAAQTPSRLHRM